MNRARILALPAPLRVLAQIVAPTGLHRPHAAIVDTAFVHCPACGVETAVTVHGDIVQCTEGHRIDTSGGTG